MTTTIPILIEVESSRFAAWQYAAETAQLFVRFKPNKNSLNGKTYVYKNVAAEQWEDAQEAESKGAWLNDEIIKNANRHPYELVDDGNGNQVQRFATDGVFMASSSFRIGDHARDADAEKLAAAMHQKAVPNNNTATLEDMLTIPAAVREIQQVGMVTVPTLPEILPPGTPEQPSFRDTILARAKDIVAAIPQALQIASAEQYRAFGAALVNVKQERKAVEEALNTVARPLIDAKKALDLFRAEVNNKYALTEKAIDDALSLYRREEARRAEAERMRIQQEQAEIQRKRAEEEYARRREQQAKEAEAIRVEAERQKAEAAQLAAKATDAQAAIEAAQVIENAERNIALAQEIATAPITITQNAPVPVMIERENLQVKGLRKKAAKWRFRFKNGVLKQELPEGATIRRTDLHNPDVIPAQYWILDEKALTGHVSDMGGRSSIEAIEGYDANA